MDLDFKFSSCLRSQDVEADNLSSWRVACVGSCHAWFLGFPRIISSNAKTWKMIINVLSPNYQDLSLSLSLFLWIISELTWNFLRTRNLISTETWCAFCRHRYFCSSGRNCHCQQGSWRTHPRISIDLANVERDAAVHWESIYGGMPKAGVLPNLSAGPCRSILPRSTECSTCCKKRQNIEGNNMSQQIQFVSYVSYVFWIICQFISRFCCTVRHHGPFQRLCFLSAGRPLNCENAAADAECHVPQWVDTLIPSHAIAIASLSPALPIAKPLLHKRPGLGKWSIAIFPKPSRHCDIHVGQYLPFLKLHTYLKSWAGSVKVWSSVCSDLKFTDLQKSLPPSLPVRLNLVMSFHVFPLVLFNNHVWWSSSYLRPVFCASDWCTDHFWIHPGSSWHFHGGLGKWARNAVRGLVLALLLGQATHAILQRSKHLP